MMQIPCGGKIFWARPSEQRNFLGRRGAGDFSPLLGVNPPAPANEAGLLFNTIESDENGRGGEVAAEKNGA